MANRKTIASHKVVICISLIHSAEREFLSGVFEFLDLGYRWRIQINQESPPFTAKSLRQAEQDGVNGIIVSDAYSRDLIPEFITTPIPLAVISGVGYKETHPLIARRQPTVAVHNDNLAISALAARHLLSCGKFNSFGFVPAGRGIVWSDEREAGFVNAMKAKGQQVKIYDMEQGCLENWLSSLSGLQVLGIHSKGADMIQVSRK